MCAEAPLQPALSSRPTPALPSLQPQDPSSAEEPPLCVQFPRGASRTTVPPARELCAVASLSRRVGGRAKQALHLVQARPFHLTFALGRRCAAQAGPGRTAKPTALPVRGRCSFGEGSASTVRLPAFVPLCPGSGAGFRPRCTSACRRSLGTREWKPAQL